MVNQCTRIHTLSLLLQLFCLLDSVGSLQVSVEEVQEKVHLHVRAFRKPHAPAPPLSRNGLLGTTRRAAIQLHDYPQQPGIHDYTTIVPDHPRIVHLERSSHHSTDRHEHAPIHEHEHVHVHVPTRRIDSLSPDLQAKTAYHYLRPYEKPYHQFCHFMEKWQDQFHPTCNQLHELDTDDVSLLSMTGSWRSTWKLTTDVNETLVLKMLQLDRDFDHQSFSYHQTDAMALERLTSSRFVVTSYGYCGQSILVEWAPNDARAVLKDTSIGSMERLRMSRDLARGLNHIHSIDNNFARNATLCHNDINAANIINVNKQTLKFNDFNIAVPLKWNHTKPCGYPVRFRGDLWRSPEEVRNETYVSEKTDIYALGNVLFQVLTRHQPWTWIEPEGKLALEQVARRKLEGKVPTFPARILNTTKLAQQAMYYGTLACYNPDPRKRPTAYQLSKGFHEAMAWVAGKEKRSIEEIKRLFATDSRSFRGAAKRQLE